MSEHSGHRERMSKKVEEGMLGSFAPHEVLEFLLFYAIPQKNVNSLAHALIERFGSLGAVLRADAAALREVRGVGQYTAEFLREMGALVDGYHGGRAQDRKRVTTLREALVVLREQTREERAAWCGILLQDNAGYLLHCEVLPWRTPDEQGPRRIADMVLRFFAYNVVVMQYRPPPARRTQADMDEAAALVRLLTAIDAYTVDYVFLLGEDTFSLRAEGYMTDKGLSLREESEFPYEGWLSG